MLKILSYKWIWTAGLLPAVCFFSSTSFAQVKWMNVDTAFAPLPSTVQVFKTTDSLDGKPFVAYYVKAKLKDKELNFTADTTLGRRLTPQQFFDKNDKPLVVVNCTFFNFDKNQNLNVVVKNGKMVGYNIHSLPMKGKDTFQYRHAFGSALGIDKKRNADVAWLFSDSSMRQPLASQQPLAATKDSLKQLDISYVKSIKYSTDHPIDGDLSKVKWKSRFVKWKVRTAVGGGPVLVQKGLIKVTNEEELKFTGKAINDKHPRTCMGYTSDGYLVIMAIQGRFPGIAEGATLEQQAKLLIELGCVEALNLDGGGSSCLLVNGKETIKPSDKTGERPVPAVFLIKQN